MPIMRALLFMEAVWFKVLLHSTYRSKKALYWSNAILDDGEHGIERALQELCLFTVGRIQRAFHSNAVLRKACTDSIDKFLRETWLAGWLISHLQYIETLLYTVHLRMESADALMKFLMATIEIRAVCIAIFVDHISQDPEP